MYGLTNVALWLGAAAVSGDITGSGGATVGGVASAGSAQEVIQGSGGATVAGVASAGSAEEIYQGSGGATTDGVDSAGSGVVVHHHGGGGAETGGVAAAGSGEELLQATGGAASGGIASAGTGEEIFQSSGAATTGGVAAGGVGLLGDDFTGSGGAIVGGVASAGAGATDVTGSGGATTGGVAGAGVGTYGDTYTGTGGATTGGVAAAGSGTYAELFGSGGGTTGGVAGAGTAEEIFRGTGGASTRVDSSGSGALAISGSGGAVVGGVAAGGSETTIAGSGGATIGGVSATGSGCVPEVLGPVYDCLFAPASAVVAELVGASSVYTDEASAVAAAIADLVGTATAYDCDTEEVVPSLSCCKFEEGGVSIELEPAIVGVGGASLGGVGSFGNSLPIGLLNEPSAVNHVGYNTDFSLTGWNRAGNTVTTGRTLGESTLGVLVTGTGIMTHQRVAVILPNAICCLSIYWKPGTATGGRFSLRNLTSGAAEVVLTFDNVGGVPGNLVLTGASAGQGTGFFAVPTASGWYRLYFWLDNFGTTSHTRQFSVANTGPAGSTGEWALMQMEAGRDPTSPIKTTGVETATRSADIFEITGLSGVGGVNWTYAYKAKSLQREQPHTFKGWFAPVDDALGEFIRWNWNLSGVPAGLQHQCWSTGHPAHAAGDLPTNTYNKIFAYAAWRGDANLVSFKHAEVESNPAPPYGGHASIGSAPNFSGLDRIAICQAPLILYCMSFHNATMTDAEVRALINLPWNQLPSANRTLFADLSSQAIPAGWTYSRASAALDERFVDRAINTPRWGSGIF